MVRTKAGEKRQLTATGRQLSQLPVDPRLAKMLLSAVSQGALHEVMIIVAALSIQDPRERPQEKQQASDENIVVLLIKNQISWLSSIFGVIYKNNKRIE